MSTEQLWDTFANRLKGYILSKVKDDMISDDILQDVFVKVHLKKDELEDDSKFGPWLFTIARNSINDYYRGLKHFDEVEEIADSDEEAGYEKDIRCMNTCLIPLTSAWSPEDRTLFNMVDVQHIPQIEIAEQLNIPYSTLKSRIQKLRKEIKMKLVQCCQIELNDRDEIVSVDCPKCG